MRILIRLPNWLGDVVMSVAFVKAARQEYPNAEIGVIVKKGLEPLLAFFPPLQFSYIFSKTDYKGLTGLIRFGKKIRREGNIDIYFCLPDSFSSAWMGLTMKAKQRVGYRKELRSLLLTHAYEKDSGLHRVEQYIALLSLFTGHTYQPDVSFPQDKVQKNQGIIVNFNSEASSRRLPLAKAVTLFNLLRQLTTQPILLIGGPHDVSYTEQLLERVYSISNVFNYTGKTGLTELAILVQQSSGMLSTDSGPAHLANAFNIPLVVLFGAGNEFNTGPYNKGNAVIIRAGQLLCEPCVNNECKLYGSPRCLEILNEKYIVQQVIEKIK